MRRLWWVLAVAGLLSGCTGYVWGDNTYGQLGDGTTGGISSVPVVEGSASEWFVLAAGENHNCGVKNDLSLWCWGRNDRGQVGNGVKGTIETSPVQIGAGNTWLNVSPGYDHSCGIDTAKRLWCWGRNNAGQLGLGDVTERLTPTQVGTNSDWNSVTLSAFSTCGIRTTDDLYCWGSNTLGELGIGDNTDRLLPTQVSGSWRNVDGGGRFFCAITTTQELNCWGSNISGQLGTDDVRDRSVPVPVVMRITGNQAIVDPADVAWKTVTAGLGHTCGLFELTGAVFAISDLSCWGTNSRGQLGFPFNVSGIDNVLIDDNGSIWDVGWTRITAGGRHTCGVQNGNLKCWGANDDGQLGDNTTTDRSVPTPVSIETEWVGISAGFQHTVGTRNTN